MKRGREFPPCFCGAPCREVSTHEDASLPVPSRAKERFFFACATAAHCGFFQWADREPREHHREHFARHGYSYEQHVTGSGIRNSTVDGQVVDKRNEDRDPNDASPPSAMYEYALRKKSEQQAMRLCRCAICLNPMVDARTNTVCRHSFCLHCALSLLQHSRNGEKAACPTCRAPLSLETLGEPDKTLQALLDDLEVLCPHRVNGDGQNGGGCTWIGPRSNLADHCRSHMQSSSSEDGQKKMLDWEQVQYDPQTPIHRFCKCFICLSVMVDPVTTTAGCEHSFCRICIEELCRNGPIPCPQCGCGGVSKQTLQRADKTLRGLLAELKCYCPNKCRWLGPRSELEKHFAACDIWELSTHEEE